MGGVAAMSDECGVVVGPVGLDVGWGDRATVGVVARGGPTFGEVVPVEPLPRGTDGTMVGGVVGSVVVGSVVMGSVTGGSVTGGSVTPAEPVT